MRVANNDYVDTYVQNDAGLINIPTRNPGITDIGYGMFALSVDGGQIFGRVGLQIDRDIAANTVTATKPAQTAPNTQLKFGDGSASMIVT